MSFETVKKIDILVHSKLVGASAFQRKNCWKVLNSLRWKIALLDHLLVASIQWQSLVPTPWLLGVHAFNSTNNRFVLPIWVVQQVTLKWPPVYYSNDLSLNSQEVSAIFVWDLCFAYANSHSTMIKRRQSVLNNLP